jgi:hypothetical protein
LTYSKYGVILEKDPILELGMSRTAPKGKTRESVALSAFFKISEEWVLTTQQQMKLLGMTSESTFYEYKKDPERARIDQDKLERLSFILGIYKDLKVLFGKEESARTWIKKNNSAEPFRGRTALEFLTAQGSMIDLYTVRRYLAAQRGV